ncbi:MAG: DUF4175 family protein [Alphaproteobacteria bacterium]|nr:DUF4175 family protein [Alphaproteobacteria bacterium]
MPEGSELIVRAQGAPISTCGWSARRPALLGAGARDRGRAASAVNLRQVLEASADLEIRNGGELVTAWRIAIEPDAAPTIRLLTIRRNSLAAR